MRAWLITILACCTVAAASASAPANLVPIEGTVRVGARPHGNAVIWLEAGPAVGDASQRQPVMDQRNLQFLPQVLAVRVGTTVRFPNGDRVFHNVFSFKDGKKFDLGMYPVGAVKYVRFDQAGVSRLFCNIHPKMAAYIVAVDTPYFATSDERGAFHIEAPAGRYTYSAWRPGGELLTGTVTVAPGSALEVAWP